MKKMTEHQLFVWALKQKVLKLEGLLSWSQVQKMEEIPGWQWEFTDEEAAWLDVDPGRLGARRLVAAALNAKLAVALDAYTSSTNPEYDPEFNAKIRKIAPWWFPPDNVERN
jgi:hypothetical protein